MATIFVATSKSLQAWGSDVGLTKHLFKVDITEDTADAMVARMNADRHGGRQDWTLLKAETTEKTPEEALAKISTRETAVDPLYYPQIKGAGGIFKVKPTNAENHFFIESALAGRERKAKRVSPAEIATYLLRNA
ncbi:MAG: hypothetical protein U1E42_12265 [Rhodospirillales bacterium]